MATSNLERQISDLQTVLRTFTRKFTYDRDESLDLVQDTMLRALTNKDRFRENTNLRGWLFTIMRNIFINNYRKQKQTRTWHDTTKELYHLNVEDTHTFNGPAASVEYQSIWSDVNSLPDALLIPFKMHASGYKYHEIAEQQKIPIGTVKNRIFHARKEIQKKLADDSRRMIL